MLDKTNQYFSGYINRHIDKIVLFNYIRLETHSVTDINHIANSDT